MFTIDTRLNNGNQQSTGFWIRGNTIYPIRSSHIRAILDNPELFGFTKPDLIKQFKRHHEKIGFEGKARKEVIIEAVRSGWIRGRYYPISEEYFSLTVSSTSLAGNYPNDNPEERTECLH